MRCSHTVRRLYEVSAEALFLFRKMPSVKRFICLLVLLVLAGSVAGPAQSGNLGLQGGYSGDLDWYIGVRTELETAMIFKNSRSTLDFNWFFPDGDNFKYFDFNLNYLWPVKTLIEDTKTNLYVGLGLNVGRGWIENIDDSDNWEIGMNTLAGFAYGLGRHVMFLEFGYTFFSDYDQWRLGTGFLF